MKGPRFIRIFIRLSALFQLTWLMLPPPPTPSPVRLANDSSLQGCRRIAGQSSWMGCDAAIPIRHRTVLPYTALTTLPQQELSVLHAITHTCSKK